MWIGLGSLAALRCIKDPKGSGMCMCMHMCVPRPLCGRQLAKRGNAAEGKAPGIRMIAHGIQNTFYGICPRP